MADLGTAKTKCFMLGQATVMLGPQSDLLKLTPENNRLGLVKNFQLTYDVGYVELTQGVQNNIVDSTMNKSDLRSSWEVYEYTSSNLAYALGLNGSSYSTNTPVATTLTATTTGTPATPDATVEVASAAGLNVGDWLIFQGSSADEIYADQILSMATTTITLAKGLPAALEVGAVVKKSSVIDLASSDDQPYLAMVAVGKLSDGSRIRVEVPKLRITKGFTFQFDSSKYGNMPFEATVYRPTSDDPNYSMFSTRAARMFKTN